MNISNAIRNVERVFINFHDIASEGDIESFEIAVEALEKQKPTEVKMFSADFGRCPACDSIVDRVDYYCRYCGQRLE